MQIVIDAEEIIIKTVKPRGNSGYVYVPNPWVGREVIVVLKKGGEKKWVNLKWLAQGVGK